MEKAKKLLGLVHMVEEGTYQYGFDHTDISAANWEKILKRAGVTEMEPEHVGKEGEVQYWEWNSKKIKIVTLNNPITGEYANTAHKRGNEKDFAGYIGLEGDQDTVETIAKMIKTWADEIKDESPGSRDFI